MGNLQVKNIPEGVHDELRRRARQSAMTVRDYVLDLLRRDQAGPSRADWLEALHRLGPVRIGRPAADVVNEARASVDRRGHRR